MSITTKEVTGPRPLSRAELEARIKELRDELHFVKQKFVYIYPENNND